MALSWQNAFADVSGHATPPIIFISAVSPAEIYAFKGYELGAVDYVSTSTLEVLRAKVAVFVDSIQQGYQGETIRGRSRSAQC